MQEGNVNLTLDEMIIKAALKRNPKRVKLEADKAGNVLLDKKLYPDIFNWAENG